MKFRSYNREIKFATAQVIDVFNNILVQRSDLNNNIQTEIYVPCLYGQVSRELKSLSNKNKTIKLPLISISITSIERDTARVHSVNERLFFQKDGAVELDKNVAIPINITYELSIIAKYQEDIEQLIGNFMAIMNPDIYVVLPNPKDLSNLKTQLIWDGSINLEYPEELDEQTPWRLIATSSILCKTWVFPGSVLTWNRSIGNYNYPLSGLVPGVSGVSGEGIIKTINSSTGLSGSISGSISGITSGNSYSFWYDIPNYMTFTEYSNNISSGLIKNPNFDIP